MFTFLIQDEPYELQLTNVKHVYSENYDKLYLAQNTCGRYYPDLIHNYRMGLFCQNGDGSNDILIPFIYKNIVRFQFKSSSWDDFNDCCPYYFAQYDVSGKTYYSIFAEEEIPFRCLAKFIKRKIEVNKRLMYIKFFDGSKVGIIKHGFVMIPPVFSSIKGFKITCEDENTEPKNLFLVSTNTKKGLYINEKCILPIEYDSISIDSENRTCNLLKDNHYFYGNFNKVDLNLSVREVSKQDFLSSDCEEDDIDNDYNPWDHRCYSHEEALYDALGGEPDAIWNIDEGFV